LLIFAVFGLLSACDNFIPYEPVGSFLDFDDKLIYLAPVNASEKRKVTVIKSSKQKAFPMRWFLIDDVNNPPKNSNIARVDVTFDDGSQIDSNTDKDTGITECTVTKTTTYTFTVTARTTGKTTLYIGLHAVPDKPVYRWVEIIVNAVTPSSASGD
jgi:hypothetical protein